MIAAFPVLGIFDIAGVFDQGRIVNVMSTASGLSGFCAKEQRDPVRLEMSVEYCAACDEMRERLFADTAPPGAARGYIKYWVSGRNTFCWCNTVLNQSVQVGLSFLYYIGKGAIITVLTSVRRYCAKAVRPDATLISVRASVARRFSQNGAGCARRFARRSRVGRVFVSSCYYWLKTQFVKLRACFARRLQFVQRVGRGGLALGARVSIIEEGNNVFLKEGEEDTPIVPLKGTIVHVIKNHFNGEGESMNT